MPGGLPRRWHGHAFGLALHSGFELAGCADRELDAQLPPVVVELTPTGTPDAEHARSDAPELTQDAHGGYRFNALQFGLFRVSRDGKRVSCAPNQIECWRWQRYLTGRVLPFTCTLRGLEPWHASAVALSGGAIAFAGASGRGKSTLAAELILRGARLLADDVLALEHVGTQVRAHPGPGLMSLRTSTAERLGLPELGRLGRRVGDEAKGIRLAVPRARAPHPLRAVYLLEPAETNQGVTLSALPRPDPRLLLGSTFSFAPLAPERLTTQLDVCAAIARSVRVVRIELPSDADYPQVAQTLMADAAARQSPGEPL